VRLASPFTARQIYRITPHALVHAVLVQNDGVPSVASWIRVG
jgi:hypothetical protein